MARPPLSRLRPSLSILGARVAQGAYRLGSRSRFGFRVVERLLVPRGPRATGPGGADVDRLVRPVLVPQRGRGIVRLDAVPDHDGDVARLALRVRAKQRVIVPAEIVADNAPAIIAMAASGVPLEARTLPDEVSEQLGGTLATLLMAPPAEDAIARELRSVRLRRAALPLYWQQRAMSPLPDASVSVLLASQRPDAVLGAVEQVAQQSWRGAQLVVGLHGAAWEPGVEAAIAERWGGDLVVARVSERANLGDVLNELTLRGDGVLLTKWDDDDWYGRDHLLDLVLAYAYSGAEVVGKAAEFVYLEGSDRTIRRFAIGAESYRWTIAGGTLMTSRNWLEHVGGWPRIERGVDQSFLRATRAAGGRAYRTHGFQYILRRGAAPAHSHTWKVGDEHFLATASTVREGLDLALADVEPPWWARS